MQIEQLKFNGLQLFYSYVSPYQKFSSQKLSLVNFSRGSDCEVLIKAMVMGMIKGLSSFTYSVRQWPISRTN